MEKLPAWLRFILESRVRGWVETGREPCSPGWLRKVTWKVCLSPFDTWQSVLDGEGAEVACEGREMIDLLVLFCGFRPTGHQP